MNQVINTLELARLYEGQGYYQDAYDMYAALDREASTNQTRAGMERMRKKIGLSMDVADSKERISKLLERWVKLVVLKHRLSKYQKIKSRLI